MELATLAGAISTSLFAAANVPMVVRAVRTKDMTSYSLSALIVSNGANIVHTAYVVSLPFGPIWVLHGFYLVSMALMITMRIRFASRAARYDHTSTGCPR
jgi:uncharacterized protein with PQ loop repeat